MTDRDKRPFLDELRRMGIAFGKDVDSALAAVYFDALADLEWPTVQAAMRDCVASMSWLPKPADIRDAEFGVRAREEQARTRRLIAAAPELVREGITEAQWQERWAALRGIMARVPMKPHHGLEGDRCQCADHKRQREEARRATR